MLKSVQISESNPKWFCFDLTHAVFRFRVPPEAACWRAGGLSSHPAPRPPTGRPWRLRPHLEGSGDTYSTLLSYIRCSLRVTFLSTPGRALSYIGQVRPSGAYFGSDFNTINSESLQYELQFNTSFMCTVQLKKTLCVTVCYFINILKFAT